MYLNGLAASVCMSGHGHGCWYLGSGYGVEWPPSHAICYSFLIFIKIFMQILNICWWFGARRQAGSLLFAAFNIGAEIKSYLIS